MLMYWRAAFHDFLLAMIAMSKPSKAHNHADFRRYDSPKLGRLAPKFCDKTVSTNQSCAAFEE